MVQTYSVSFNPASSMIAEYSLRQGLVQCYVKATIFYLLQSPSLESWLSDPMISAHLAAIKPDYIDLDTAFTRNLDRDFDDMRRGITLQSFGKVYGEWIMCCLNERLQKMYVEE